MIKQNFILVIVVGNINLKFKILNRGFGRAGIFYFYTSVV